MLRKIVKGLVGTRAVNLENAFFMAPYLTLFYDKLDSHRF